MRHKPRRWTAASAALDLLLLPLVCGLALWGRRREAKILREGKALNMEQLALADAVGVAAPQRVRVSTVDAVPMPLPTWLQPFLERRGWLSPHIAGMTLGHGIVLRGDVCADRRLLAHELAHVAQYERCGSMGGFMREYVRECVWPGYPHGPLEIEARRAETVAGGRPVPLSPRAGRK